MSKRALIAKYLEDIRASYWFLPTNLALFAVILAQLSLWVDKETVFLPEAWLTTQVDGARSTLAVMSQATIGVAGVMFSITIVAVSFASGNFGPRLIGNFMRDRGTQWSLGILIATFVYALLVLRAVQSPYGPDGDNAAFVPHLSILLAFGLTAISVMAMIYYVHHIPEIINVSNISAGLGRRLKAALEGEAGQPPSTTQGTIIDFPESAPDCTVSLRDCGYIQTWNKELLKQLAQEHDIFVAVQHVAGDFVSPNTAVLKIWNVSEPSDELSQSFRDCFALGQNPTEPQNPLFIVSQLVEMVARAMSPGVNDPFTAVNCINWLYVGLGAATDLMSQLDFRTDGRVQYPVINFAALLDASFGRIEPYVRDDRIVMSHLFEVTDRLAQETENKQAKAALQGLIDRLKNPADT